MRKTIIAMKNILLLTDFTLKSDNAHAYTFNFFKGQECEFHLLSIQKTWEYTTDDLMSSSPRGNIDNALLGDNRTKVDAMIAHYKEAYSHSLFTFQGHVDYDVFTDAISQAVTAYDIDLVVCGTDGKTGIVENIFSSHALRIIRKVECPVLVIPENYGFITPKRIQYLLDYDDNFEMCGKEPLIDITHKYASSIDVLRLTFGFHMEDHEFEYEHTEIEKLFPSTTVTYARHIDEDPVAVIRESLLKKSCQLQVLSAKNQTFLERIFSYSHLSQIVNTVTTPLLILRDCNS